MIHFAIGTGTTHLAERALFDFSSVTGLLYGWETQGELGIRRFRELTGTYGHPDGGGLQTTLGYVDTTDPDEDNWVFRYSGDTGATAETNFRADIVTQLGVSIAALEAANGVGEQTHLLDDETLCHAGGHLGIAMQTIAGERLDTADQVAAYTAIVQRIKTGVMEDLAAEYPTHRFGFYNLPLAKRFGEGFWDDEFLDSGDEWFTDGRNSAYIAIAEASGFVDGHSYDNGALDTSGKKLGYHTANLLMMRQYAVTAGVDCVASFWIENPNSPDGLATYDQLLQFFKGCVAASLTEAAILGNWSYYLARCAALGEDPGAFWRNRVVAAAVEAEFVEDPGGAEPDPVLTIDGLTPSIVERGQTLNLTVYGASVSADCSFDFGDDIDVNSVTLVGNTRLRVNITIDSDAALGARDVVISRPGFSDYTLADGLTLIASGAATSVTITRVEPDTLLRGESGVLAIIGSGFSSNNNDDIVTVDLGEGVVVGDFTVISDGLIDVEYTVDLFTSVGARDVTVTRGEESDTLEMGLDIIGEDDATPICVTYGRVLELIPTGRLLDLVPAGRTLDLIPLGKVDCS